MEEDLLRRGAHFAFFSPSYLTIGTKDLSVSPVCFESGLILEADSFERSADDIEFVKLSVMFSSYFEIPDLSPVASLNDMMVLCL